MYILSSSCMCMISDACTYFNLCPYIYIYIYIYILYKYTYIRTHIHTYATHTHTHQYIPFYPQQITTCIHAQTHTLHIDQVARPTRVSKSSRNFPRRSRLAIGSKANAESTAAELITGHTSPPHSDLMALGHLIGVYLIHYTDDLLLMLCVM